MGSKEWLSCLLVITAGACSARQPAADGITPDGAIATEEPKRQDRREAVPDKLEEVIHPRMTGGPCEYEMLTGVGHVVSIEPAPEGERVCEGGASKVMVRFKSTVGEERELPLTLIGGFHPPTVCVETLELQVGSTFDMSMEVITKGSCTPWMPRFPDSLTKACDEVCVRP